MRAVSASTLRAVLLVGGAVALDACNQTHFQSPPPALSACDPHFVGSWMITEGDHPTESCDASNCDGVLTIDPECRSWHLHEPGQAESEDDRKMEEHLRMGFADVRGRKLMSVEIANEPDSTTFQRVKWPHEYLYLRYEAVGQFIRLYWVDSSQVERLIGHTVIHGRTVKTQPKANPDRPNPKGTDTDNYVEGDSREMARVALLPRVFEDRVAFVLKPVAPADIVKPAPTSLNP